MRPADLRYAVAMLTFAVVVFLTYREGVLGPLLAGLTDLTTRATFLVLGRLEPGVAREANIILQPGGFAYEIYYRCTGFLPVACFTVGILAYPAGNRSKKLLGLAVGIPLLLVLNLVRLVHLFRIGVSRPDLFDLAHDVVWECTVILAVVGLWLGWVAWTDSQALKRLARRQAAVSYFLPLGSDPGRQSAVRLEREQGSPSGACRRST